MYYTIIKTHMCDIILVGDENGLSYLHLNTSKGKRNFEIDEKWIYSDDFFEDTIKQIEEYFSAKRTKFNIKLNPKGTEYQKSVWNELRKISFGEIKTYKEIAVNIGNEKASRAVGMANSKNPIPLIVPCHRVIGTNGKLTGFAHGIEMKEKLLNFEKMIKVYNILLKYYKNQNWWPARTDYEMMVGAILTQNTTWSNVEKAIKNLNTRLNPVDILEMEEDKLAEIIKSSGYYNQKAIKLKALTKWFKGYDFNIEKAKSKLGEELRKELLSIYGVGKETADCILTYAFDKPYFVIDTYTRRLFERIGFCVPDEYDEFRKMIEKSIKKDIYIYKEYHALIVKHATTHCLKTPKCDNCPLWNECRRKI